LGKGAAWRARVGRVKMMRAIGPTLTTLLDEKTSDARSLRLRGYLSSENGLVEVCSLGVRNVGAGRSPHPVSDRRRPLNGLRIKAMKIGPFAHFFVFIALAGLVGMVEGMPVQASGEEKDLKEIKGVVKKLQTRYLQTKDLQADFTQSTRIEGFATPLSSTGRVYIKKPGRLRWDYLDPNVEEIYVNRNDVMMYVPEHKQVLVGKLTQMAASQAPLQLLQGVAKLEEQFNVEPTPGGTRGRGGVPLLTLIPKPTGSDSVRTVEKIVLELEPKTYFIKMVAIHEISGNVSTFQFDHLTANTELKDSLFEFEVPAGVEVVKAPALGPP